MDSQTGAKPLPGVFVLDTRHTLDRARLGVVTSVGDWANETHPNTTGYKKLAQKLSARLNL